METCAATAETGWRGSREGWLETGYQALIDGGIDAVKILPLARQLKLSRTSFYWLLEGREAMLNVLACFLCGIFDSKLEFAVRSWGLQDDRVAGRVADADERRLAALREMLMRWGHHQKEADVRARTIYLTQIGYISMRAQEDVEIRLARIPTYVEIHTGQPPEPREIARFKSAVKPSS